MLNMIDLYYFSPTGGTKKVGEKVFVLQLRRKSKLWT